MMTCYQKQDFYVYMFKNTRSFRKRSAVVSFFVSYIQKLVLSFLFLGFKDKGFIVCLSIYLSRLWYYVVFVFFFLYFSFYLLWQFCYVVQELYTCILNCKSILNEIYSYYINMYCWNKIILYFRNISDCLRYHIIDNWSFSFIKAF